MKTFDVTPVLEALAVEAFRAGGQNKLAEKLGISPTLMSMILKRKRGIPNKVLYFVGFERVTRYVKSKPTPAVSASEGAVSKNNSAR